MTQEVLLTTDLSLDRLDIALQNADGHYLLHHQAFPNNWSGYQALRQELLTHLASVGPANLIVVAESTGNYWWHLFYHISHDPALASYAPKLALLNPAHVKNFRRALPEEDKADDLDPHLIATYYRTARTKTNDFYTFQPRYLPLRHLARAYCRLIHNLASEKGYILSLVYLLASEYVRCPPFSDLLGVASTYFLTAYPDIAGLADLPLEEVVELVRRSSRGPFPNIEENARRLQNAARNSYPLPDFLRPTVRTLFDLTLERIRFLQEQQKTYRRLIEEQLDRLPEAQLALAEPGLGPILVGGCLGEIQDTRRFTTGLKYDRKKGTLRPRTYRDGQAAVARMAGLWWPTKSSGRFTGQGGKLARERNPYLRFWLVQATVSLKGHRADIRDYYRRKHAESKHHPHLRALILTARKVTRLIFALLHKGQQQWLKEGPEALSI